MDKNTIIGFLLIAVVMIAFMITQRPSEELLRERQIQDSIQQLNTARAQLQVEELPETSSPQDDSTDVLTDFFGGESISEDTTFVAETAAQVESAVDTAASFVPVGSITAEEFVTIENEDLRLKVSTKGGWMHSAELIDF